MEFPLAENSRGRTALVISWVLTVISTILVALRVYVKVRTTRRLWWDDWFMVMAEIWGYYHSIMSTLGIKYGIGAHMTLLRQSQISSCLRYGLFAFAGAFISPTFGRLSFCMFLLSLVWRSNRIPRWPLWVFMILQVVVNTISTILMYAQCGSHISALWNLDIPILLTKCWKFDVQTYWGYAAGSFNTLTDLFLSVYPVFIVSFSSLTPKSKFAVMSLLSLSLLAMIAAVKRTLEAKAFLEYSDFTYNLIEYLMWGSIELHVVIIATTIPLLRPLFRRGGLAQLAQRQAIADVRGTTSQYPLSSIDKKHTGSHTLSISSQDNILTPAEEQFAITRTVEVSISYTAQDRSMAHLAIVGLPMD